jgi:uncharacterized protein DUF7008/Eco57I restriction-modification methylase
VVAVSPDLTAALKKVVLELEDDLRARVESQPEVLDDWRQQHSAAVARERTGMSWQEWRDDRLTMAAVAWLLTTVFVRFCEDNRLLKPVWIAGPSERRQEALDAELAYFREHPEHTDREWLTEAVDHLRSVKATRELVESHSSLWTVAPSGQAAKRLIEFWRTKTDAGALVWDFTDPELSTRFLGDLYQDLSDHAKKTYALLQTPVFVEEFILDQTLEPALTERPLEGFTLIDPACGSGHFLLGAFARLNKRWADQEPGLEVRARVERALASVHGIDLNPFAIAIAKFRLMVAALQACGELSLEEAPNFHFNLATGDSLLHGGHQLSLQFEDFDADAQISGFAYDTEDLAALQTILEPGRYDVVVANPPYITVKDKRLNAAYRELYGTCKGTYALTVPFMERLFQLAKRPSGDRPAGWMGQITSNSFMKREFGSKLIEEFLARQDLRLIVDTSGAYIPGHGTPTVILVGRRQAPVGDTVRAVLGTRGEPGAPADPAKGLVWSSISDHVADSEFDNEYISVTDLPRLALATHPWSLSGGGATDALSVIEANAYRRLGDVIDVAGRTTHTGNDEAFFVPLSSINALHLARDVIPIVLGDNVRDYQICVGMGTVFPYDSSGDRRDLSNAALQHLWRVRRSLETQLDFGRTKVERGLRWFDHSMFFPSRYTRPLSLSWPGVATHNHFVLDRGGKVFNRWADAIKLPKEATEDDHLALLGVLNSSTACFWLKQNSHNKGEGGGARVTAGYAARGEPFRETYEFTGTTLRDFPLPPLLPVVRGRRLDALAQDSAASSPNEVADGAVPTATALTEAGGRWQALRGTMVAEQEELDWEMYRSYGLLDEDLTYDGRDLPELRSGERAFEIALTRKVAAGEEQTTWFTHPEQRSTPVSEIPSHWPAAYRNLVQRRLDLIESDKFIRLLEKPEYKRRWASQRWEIQVELALRGWLLDKLENRDFWFDAHRRPAARSVAQLADVVSRDSDFVSVLELWSGRKDQTATQQLAALLDGESVPFLAAYRLKDSGLRKREAWENTWELQRREDAGEKVGDIPVPPKYTTADFRKTAWWQHRGKLDVPKERFILYPNAGRETDPTELLGWAGWDHAQQALALARIIGDREQEGWQEEQLLPLVAGLAELQPWVRQWHDEVDETYGLNLADFCEEQLRDRALQVHKTLDELRACRPAAATRGRRRRV